ncbi:MAG: hypothetical protein AB1437_04905 [Pseudomonadota bacterium]
MKNHFRCAAIVLLLVTIVLVYFNKIEALASSSIALQIFSVIELETDWKQRFSLSVWREVFSTSYSTLTIGALCGVGAIVLLLSDFAISA